MEKNTPSSTTSSPAADALSLPAWHARFRQQAGWTRDMRRYLYERAHLREARRVLEVGCGTGAITTDLADCSAATIHGLDLSLSHLAFAAQQAAAGWTCGDALALPYVSGAFDLTCCHFLLLWVKEPAAALAEMRRVTRPGGAMLLLAEPDYGGRIDYPPELVLLGQWQREALKRQGADVEMGRKLSALLTHAGLQAVETGVLGGQWGPTASLEAHTLEWTVLQADLADLADPEVLQRIQALDQAAWQRRERILFVPTFYAWGWVK
jgi:SAM-dependent methyltransferase